MRLYDSRADYPTVLKAAKHAKAPHLRPIMSALVGAGVIWPVMHTREDWKPSPDAEAVGADVLRAWQELGYAK